jgi:hypothetical protein
MDIEVKTIESKALWGLTAIERTLPPGPRAGPGWTAFP